MVIAITRGLMVAISHCGLDPQIWGKDGQRWSNRLLRVKANVVPSHTRVLYETILPIRVKTSSPRKIGLCLGRRHPGRVQAHQGKREEMTKIQIVRGAPLTPDMGANHPHMVAILGSALCNRRPPTHLQPCAQNLNPTPKKHHPKSTKMVAVTRLGWHRNRHPCKPSYTQHLLTYTQAAVVSAIKLRVLVRMAVNRNHAITAEEDWFGHDSF